MTQENEKNVLVHWYYSVSEWESFILRVKKKSEVILLGEAVFVWILGFFTICFGRNTDWLPAIVISGNIALAYGIVKYYLRKLYLKWKQPQMPEIVITNGTATVNGKPTVFQGDGKWLRKADIREMDNINILEITYEWKTGKGITFDELKIPVPRGKLREAMELLDCLNLRKDVLSLFV